MPAPQNQYYNFVAAATSSPNGTETVVATTPAVSSSYPNCLYGLVFIIAMSVGVGATTVTIRVRRDSLTGAVVLGPTAFSIVASTLEPFVVGLSDTIAGDQASQVWVLTTNVTGGAAAGSVTNAYSCVTVAS